MAATNRQRRIARHHRGRSVAESTGTLERAGEAFAEAATDVKATRPGRIAITLIKAGWSVNGRYYPAAVLKRDGPSVWPAGTLSFADHQTDEEQEQRPAGSVRNLVGVLTRDPVWDEASQSLKSELRVFAPWREAVADWTQSGAIGMSIRAWAEGEQGEAEGRRGTIVTALYGGRGSGASVDVVTIPAAGGSLDAVLESVGAGTKPIAEARSVGGWVESRIHRDFTVLADDMYGSGRLTRQERIILSSAIGDGLGAFVARVEADAPHLYERDIWDEPGSTDLAAEATLARPIGEATSEEIRRALTAALREQYATGRSPVYIWLRDYDADRALCWYEQSTRDGDCTDYQQGYSVGEGGRIVLAEERVAVVARTVWEPAPTPASQATVRAGETTSSTSDTKTSATPVAEEVSPVDGPGSPNIPIQRKESTVDPKNPAETGAGGTGEPARTPAPPQYAEAMHQSHEALLAKQAEAAREREAREAAERKLRVHEAKEAARGKVAEAIAKSPLAKVGAAHPRIIESVVATADVWLDADGKADQARLDVTIEATISREATYLAQAAEQMYGVGKVRGLGSSEADTTESVDDLAKNNDKIMAEIAALTGTARKGA